MLLSHLGIAETERMLQYFDFRLTTGAFFRGVIVWVVLEICVD
jgi:hypothetical protein